MTNKKAPDTQSKKKPAPKPTVHYRDKDGNYLEARSGDLPAPEGGIPCVTIPIHADQKLNEATGEWAFPKGYIDPASAEAQATTDTPQPDEQDGGLLGFGVKL